MLSVPFNCTGCNACASICPKKCIELKDMGEGFLFPVIDDTKCIQCHQCERACLILKEQKKSVRTQAYAIKNIDETERKISASGGVFPLLAKYTLDKKGIVFGAAYDENFEVKHIALTDYSKLPLVQGAKYVQSIIGISFREAEMELKSGRKVLFSGTPCQCAGLKAFLGKEYENLLLVDVICHGVPSTKVWQTYIDYRSAKENSGIRPIRINMRSKTSGWSRYGYSTEFDYGYGHITRVRNSQDLFMKAFVGNICLRNSCSDCPAKGIERCTDFTLGDYWGVWDQHPEFDDNKGTSIVFIHSEKGKNVFRHLEDKMEYIEVNVEEAYQENNSLVSSVIAHEKRQDFLEKITVENFEEKIREYFPPVMARSHGILQRVKEKVKSAFHGLV